MCSYRAVSIDHQKFYSGIRIFNPTSCRHLLLQLCFFSPLCLFPCTLSPGIISYHQFYYDRKLALTWSTDTQQPSICGHWDAWQQSFFSVGHCSLPSVHMTCFCSSKKNSGLFWTHLSILFGFFWLRNLLLKERLSLLLTLSSFRFPLVVDQIRAISLCPPLASCARLCLWAMGQNCKKLHSFPPVTVQESTSWLHT